jgi:DNA repair exonuclease SbcCD ATPase subunit
MRIVGVEVEGFRGFVVPHRFDLDASAVVLVGANGSGKTSFLDAILWALTGKVERIEAGGGTVVSGYGGRSGTRVMIRIRGSAGDVLEVTRSVSPGAEPRVSVRSDHGDELVRGLEAEAELIRRLWPDALEARDPQAALSEVLTRGVYLQQDLLRQFVESDSETRRFDILSELVGGGRVRDLQGQLEREKRAWSTATNALTGEAESLRAQIRERQSALDRLSPPAEEPPELAAQWEDWWNRVQAAGVAIQQPALGGDDAATLLDSALEQLATIAQRNSRRLARIQEALEEFTPATPQGAIDETPHETALKAARELERQAESALATALQQAADQRARAIAQQEQASELAALAQLALRHLSDVCPVCLQSFDLEATTEHLRVLIGAAENFTPGGSDAQHGTGVETRTAELEGARAGVAAAQAALDDVQRRKRAAAAQDQARLDRLVELGIKPSERDSITALSSAEAATHDLLGRIEILNSDGGQLALTMTRRSEVARRGRLESELRAMRRRLDDLDLQVAQRARTGELAQAMIEQIRSGSSRVIREQLEALQPLLRRVYARIDPHPALRDVSLRAWTDGGRGRVEPVLTDEVFGFQTNQPATVLSSSQLNALAVTTFISLNLGMPGIPMDVAILDDPMQSLDDVNLLGLVDLLRRVRSERQLIVSTHDRNFGNLLERKLRGVRGERTIRFDFGGWSRGGPIIQVSELPSDLQPLRFVAA